LKSHQLFAAACGPDPEISAFKFANSFRGSLEMCTNRRSFQSAKEQNLLTFHAVALAPGRGACSLAPGRVPPLSHWQLWGKG